MFRRHRIKSRRVLRSKPPNARGMSRALLSKSLRTAGLTQKRKSRSRLKSKTKRSLQRARPTEASTGSFRANSASISLYSNCRTALADDRCELENLFSQANVSTDGGLGEGWRAVDALGKDAPCDLLGEDDAGRALSGRRSKTPTGGAFREVPIPAALACNHQLDCCA